MPHYICFPWYIHQLSVLPGMSRNGLFELWRNPTHPDYEPRDYGNWFGRNVTASDMFPFITFDPVEVGVINADKMNTAFMSGIRNNEYDEEHDNDLFNTRWVEYYREALELWRAEVGPVNIYIFLDGNMALPYCEDVRQWAVDNNLCSDEDEEEPPPEDPEELPEDDPEASSEDPPPEEEDPDDGDDDDDDSDLEPDEPPPCPECEEFYLSLGWETLDYYQWFFDEMGWGFQIGDFYDDEDINSFDPQILGLRFAQQLEEGDLPLYDGVTERARQYLEITGGDGVALKINGTDVAAYKKLDDDSRIVVFGCWIRSDEDCLIRDLIQMDTREFVRPVTGV